MNYMKTLFPNQTNESLNYNYFDDLNEEQLIESSANFNAEHNLEPIEHIIGVVDQKRRRGRPKTERVVEKKARRGRPPIEDSEERDRRKKMSSKIAARNYRRKKKDQLLEEQELLSDLSSQNKNLKKRFKILVKNQQILCSNLNQYQNKLNKKQKLQFLEISKKFV